MPDPKQKTNVYNAATGTYTPAAAVNPSPSFFQRVFGSESFSPEVQQGIDIARKEMPNMAPVKPYGMLSRLVQPNALAYASPGNNIYLNTRANLGQSPQDIADTLTHEQTHVNQAQENGGTFSNIMKLIMGDRLPYHQRPNEMAAFQAEKERRSRMGREQTPVPSFSTGQFYIPRDVNLPLERKK